MPTRRRPRLLSRRNHAAVEGGKRRRTRFETLERRQLLAGDVTLFADSFESGSDPNDWVGNWAEDSQDDWFRSTQRATDGSSSAEVDGSANDATLTLSDPIDLGGYSSPSLTFDWLIENRFDSGEYLALDISVDDGENWTTDVRRLDGNVSAENTWHSETIDLTPFASPELLVRFRAKASGSSEDANVDNVKITAEPAGPPELSISNGTILEAGSLDSFVSAGNGLAAPTDMVFGPDNNLYVSNRSSHEILRYDGQTGEFLGAFVSSASGGLGQPKGLTFGPDGNLYVVSRVTNNVLRYNGSDGAFLGEFVSSISESTDTPRVLHAPHGLAFGPHGHLYVGGSINDDWGVARYDGVTGAFIDEFVRDDLETPDIDETGGLEVTKGLAFGSDDNLYVVSSSTDSVLRYDGLTGQFIDEYVTAGSGGLAKPHELQFGPDGRLYVGGGDEASRVVRFEGPAGVSPGALVDVLADASHGLNKSAGLAFDSVGDLYVASRAGNEVLRYSQGVTVSLSRATDEEITVNYTTLGNTATPDVDYTSESGTLRFSPGETSKKILLVALDDGFAEGTETFDVELASDIGDPVGTVEILDDGDPANQSPTAVDDASYNVDEDGSLNVAAPGVLANDSDPENDPLTAIPIGSPSHGSVNLNPDGSFTYTPNDDFAGTDSFTYQAHDGTTGSNTATVTITVNPINDAPSAADDLAVTDEDTSLIIAAASLLSNDNDVDLDTLSISSVAQPANGALVDNGDGTYTYTPDADFHGVDSFSYTASDGNGGSDTATVSLTINQVNDPGAFGGDLLVSSSEDASTGGIATFVDTVDGFSTANFIVETNAANGFATIDASGDWTYTPAANFDESDSFVISVADDDGNVESQTISISVSPVTDLTATDDSFSGTEDTVLAGDVSTNDSTTSGGTLSFVVETNPLNGSLSLGSDGSFTYTPDEHFNGSDEFTYTVDDGSAGESLTQSVSITIDAVNDLGVFGGDLSATIDENTTASGTATFTDSADGSSSPSFSISAPATDGIASIDAAGNWDYSPSINFYGVDSFTVSAVDDDGNVETQVITITVDEVTDLTAGDDSFLVGEDGSLGGDVSLNDSTTSGGTLIFALDDGPTSGSISFGSDGSFTYTPNPDFNGSDSFTYTVSDSGSGEDATPTVTITVSQVDDPGSFDGDVSVSTDEDMPAAGTVTFSDPADGDSAPGFLISTSATSGSAAIDAAGNWSYTPNANFHGSDSFVVSATDDDGNLATRVVNITITSVNDAGTFGGDLSATIDENTSAAGTATFNDSADGDTSPGFIVSTEAVNGVATIHTNGDWDYTPNLDFVGSDTFTISVTDDDGNVENQVIAVMVAEALTGPNLSHGQIASVGGTWQTVALSNSYTSMVVVATPRYDAGSGPGVVRISNVDADSFDVRVDDAGSTPFSGGVHFIAIEEGVYDEPGFKLEAVKYSESQTSRKNGWLIDTASQGYQQSYSNPVVVGQVMSANDPDWSVFWASSNSRTSPPSSTQLNVGKHIAEDPDTARADETIGYLVIEATQSGTIEGLPFVAGVGGDTVRGVGNGSYQYSYTAMPNAKTAVLSSAGMDGGDGGWAVLQGSNPLPPADGTISLSIDEDQLGDSERNHTTEQVAYFVIDPPVTEASELETSLVIPPAETTPSKRVNDDSSDPLSAEQLLDRSAAKPTQSAAESTVSLPAIATPTNQSIDTAAEQSDKEDSLIALDLVFALLR